MAVTREGSENSLHIPVGIGSVPVQWRWACLEDVCDSIFDCPHSTPKLSNSGPLMVRTQDILSGIFRVDQAVHVSEATYRERTQRAEPTHGDLFYSREGTYFGIAAEVPKNCLVCLGQRMVLIRPNSQAVDFHYLRYWLNSPVMAAHIHGFRDGTVAERLNLPTIRILTVLLPSLPEQRAIAHILGTLDDKIELNRRMNETLEAMARALFKSWFVDFDPVRAKMEGRDTGLPQHLAELFPDRLVDSELGIIPEGWEVKSFAETVEIIGGGTPKTSMPNYWDGDIPWFSVVDAPTQSDVWVVDTAKKVTRMGIESSSTRILPVGTTIISARGTVGRIALVGSPMAMNQSCYGLRSKVSVQGLFDYFAIRELVAILQQRTHGSVFDTITRDTLARIRVVSPFLEVVGAFEARIQPPLERIRAGLLESRTLAALRDALLPKLISGELRVKDTEQCIWRTA